LNGHYLFYFTSQLGVFGAHHKNLNEDKNDFLSAFGVYIFGSFRSKANIIGSHAASYAAPFLAQRVCVCVCVCVALFAQL